MAKNGMDEIVIQGELTQIRTDGENEFAPAYLGIYLDRFFEREPIILVNSDAQPGTCQFRVTGYVPTGTLIPRDARLVFQSYVSTKNDYGATCVEDTGATSIELFEIQQGLANGSTSAMFKQVFQIQTTPQHDVKVFFISFDKNLGERRGSSCKSVGVFISKNLGNAAPSNQFIDKKFIQGALSIR